MLLLPDGSVARLGRGYVQDITLSPDGDLLAVASSFGLWLYNVSEPDPLALLEPGMFLKAVAFSADGEWLATSTENGTIKVWSVKNKSVLVELARAENEYTAELVFSPDCQYLAAGGISNRWNREEKRYCSVEVWSLPKNAKAGAAPLHIERDRIYNGMHPLAFSPDSRLLAFVVPEGTPKPYRADGYPVINSKWVLVCEITTGKHLTMLDGFNDVSSISFSPCGQFLAVGDFSAPIRVWEVPEDFSADMPPWHLHKVYQEEYYENTYQCVSYSPEGTLRTTVRSLDDYTIAVQEPEKSGMVYQHPNNVIHYCRYFQNATRLAISGDFDVHLWTLEEKHSTCVSQMHAFPPHSLHFSLKGHRLLARHLSDGIFSWDVTRPNNPPNVFKTVATKPEKDALETYFSIDISPHGKILATSAYENNVTLWEIGKDTPLASFTTEAEIKNVAFSPTAKVLACQDEGAQIYIWDVQSGRLHDTCQAKYPESQRMVFSPNGKYLVSEDLLYDVAQGEKIEAFDLEEMSIHLFSHDSTQFFCDTREAIELWDIHQCEKVLSIPKPSDVVALALSTCGKYLAGCCDEVPEVLHLWTIDDGKLVTVFEGNTPILSCTFSPDSTVLASGMDDGTILLWDMKPYL